MPRILKTITRKNPAQIIKGRLKLITQDNIDKLIELVDEIGLVKDVVPPSKAILESITLLIDTEQLNKDYWKEEYDYMKLRKLENPDLTVEKFKLNLNNRRSKASKGKGVEVIIEKIRVAKKKGKDVKEDIIKIEDIKKEIVVINTTRQEQVSKATSFIYKFLLEIKRKNYVEGRARQTPGPKIGDWIDGQRLGAFFATENGNIILPERHQFVALGKNETFDKDGRESIGPGTVAVAFGEFTNVNDGYDSSVIDPKGRYIDIITYDRNPREVYARIIDKLDRKVYLNDLSKIKELALDKNDDGEVSRMILPQAQSRISAGLKLTFEKKERMARERRDDERREARANNPNFFFEKTKEETSMGVRQYNKNFDDLIEDIITEVDKIANTDGWIGANEPELYREGKRAGESKAFIHFRPARSDGPQGTYDDHLKDAVDEEWNKLIRIAFYESRDRRYRSYSKEHEDMADSLKKRGILYSNFIEGFRDGWTEERTGIEPVPKHVNDYVKARLLLKERKEVYDQQGDFDEEDEDEEDEEAPEERMKEFYDKGYAIGYEMGEEDAENENEWNNAEGEDFDEDIDLDLNDPFYDELLENAGQGYGVGYDDGWTEYMGE